MWEGQTSLVARACVRVAEPNSPIDDHVFDLEGLVADRTHPLRRLLVDLEPGHGVKARNVLAVHRADRRLDAGIRELVGGKGAGVSQVGFFRGKGSGPARSPDP